MYLYVLRDVFFFFFSAPLKALLIHGADAMGGDTDPDGDRGFGRIHLESALPFDGESVWALYVEDADGSTTSAGMVSNLLVVSL